MSECVCVSYSKPQLSPKTEAKEVVSTPVGCEGRQCVTGACVAPSGECDGRLECPDASDESLTCPALSPRCKNHDASGKCGKR